MSVGDVDSSPSPDRARARDSGKDRAKRPPVEPTARIENTQPAWSRPAREVSKKLLMEDGPSLMGATALHLPEGCNSSKAEARSEHTSPPASPGSRSCVGKHLGEHTHGDNATRYELERLLTTAETQDKKRRVEFALGHLEDSSRGTALTTAVNKALATASTTATRAKRRGSVAGHEHTRGGTDVFRRFDANDFKARTPSDPKGGLGVRIDLTEARPSPGGLLASRPGQNFGTVEADFGRPDSARRFTVPLLPSIPEYREPGRRVCVKKATSGSEEEEKGVHRRQGSRVSDDYGTQTGVSDWGEEHGNKAAGGKTLLGLGSLAVLRCREEVADVPQALLGEATGTGVDPLHPPRAAVDGTPLSFWLSTGLFPQTLTIRLQVTVDVYEVTVACGGVNAARLHLGNGDDREAGKMRGRHRGHTLELVDEQQRSSTGGNASGVKDGTSGSLDRMVFRDSGGGRLGRADQLSLVMTSGGAPFCFVASIAIRGKFGEIGEREEREEEEEEDENED